MERKDGRKDREREGGKIHCANAILNKCTNVLTCLLESAREWSCLYHFCFLQTPG